MQGSRRTTISSLLFALAAVVAPHLAGARRKRKEPTTMKVPRDNLQQYTTSNHEEPGLQRSAAKYNVCFYAVAGGRNEFVPSLFRGEVPRAVRFGSGDFKYDNSTRYTKKARWRMQRHHWRRGEVGDEDNAACDAYIAIWQIPHIGSAGFIEKAGEDVRKMLPDEIAGKSVTIAFTEDCTKVSHVRSNGSIDAVWYHNALSDPESVLNLPLGPTHTMAYTSERTAMQRAASERKYFYNIVMSASTGRVGMHRSLRLKWQMAHRKWSHELLNLATLPNGVPGAMPRQNYCSYSSISQRWESPDSVDKRLTPSTSPAEEAEVATVPAHPTDTPPIEAFSSFPTTNHGIKSKADTRYDERLLHSKALHHTAGRGFRSLPDEEVKAAIAAAAVGSRAREQGSSAFRSRTRRTSPLPDHSRTECPLASGGGKISQQEYHTVLLNSAFTLAPAGHNIECFRIWEAAEAGSIPVLLVNETSVSGGNITETGCSLHPDVMKAPFIWATDLPDAWSQMQKLGNDDAALNAKSRAVRTWYSSYMKSSIRRFELLLHQAVDRGKGLKARSEQVNDQVIPKRRRSVLPEEAIQLLYDDSDER